LVTLRQVHGNSVVRAEAVDGAVEADGIVVTRAATIGAVKSADCVPVLLLSSEADRPWAAAVHAGWRGTVAGVIESALELASGDGHAPSMLQAAVGPAIGPCCYEVGEEVAGAFDAAGHAVIRTDGLPRLDLRAINVAILEAFGLPRAQIRVYGPCCRCRSDLYYSRRADPSQTGRQLSWIGWEDRTG